VSSPSGILGEAPAENGFIYTSLFTINGRKQVIIIVIIITVKQLN